MINEITVWTDGACFPNPGVGGWAFVTRNGPCGSGREENTTNQRMEMLAVLKALEALCETNRLVKVITDSQFVINGCTDWVFKWKENGWSRKGNKEIKHLDIWIELEQFLSAYLIEFQWVKGHSGNEMNDAVDKLANAATKVSFKERETKQ